MDIAVVNAQTLHFLMLYLFKSLYIINSCSKSHILALALMLSLYCNAGKYISSNGVPVCEQTPVIGHTDHSRLFVAGIAPDAHLKIQGHSVFFNCG